MKKVLAILSLLALFLFATGCPKHPDLVDNDTIEPDSITQVVVPVPTFLPDDSQSFSPVSNLLDYNVILLQAPDADAGICGATVVYSSTIGSLILTAAHCVMNADDQVIDHFFIETGDNDFYRVEVMDFNRADDLALLMTTDRAPVLAVAPISATPPLVGETIWVVGFGARVKDVVSKGIVAKTDLRDKTDRSFLIDCTGWYGNSGGGVFNQYGELLGVVVRFGPQFRGHGPETGWMWATNWEAIIELLQRRL